MLSVGPAILMALGGLAGFSAVVMSAVAAHALPASLDAHAVTGIHAAIDMQGWHALALLFCALWMERAAGLARHLSAGAGTAFAVGLLLFCGAVYAHHLGGVSLGAVAPTGGVLLMAGWLALAASALAARRPS